MGTTKIKFTKISTGIKWGVYAGISLLACVSSLFIGNQIMWGDALYFNGTMMIAQVFIAFLCFLFFLAGIWQIDGYAADYYYKKKMLSLTGDDLFSDVLLEEDNPYTKREYHFFSYALEKEDVAAITHVFSSSNGKGQTIFDWVLHRDKHPYPSLEYFLETLIRNMPKKEAIKKQFRALVMQHNPQLFIQLFSRLLSVNSCDKYVSDSIIQRGWSGCLDRIHVLLGQEIFQKQYQDTLSYMESCRKGINGRMMASEKIRTDRKMMASGIRTGDNLIAVCMRKYQAVVPSSLRTCPKGLDDNKVPLLSLNTKVNSDDAETVTSQVTHKH